MVASACSCEERLGASQGFVGTLPVGTPWVYASLYITIQTHTSSSRVNMHAWILIVELLRHLCWGARMRALTGLFAWLAARLLEFGLSLSSALLKLIRGISVCSWLAYKGTM